MSKFQKSPYYPYYVDTEGNVYEMDKKTGHYTKLPTKKDKNGYLYVDIFIQSRRSIFGGHWKPVRVHRIILESFNGKSHIVLQETKYKKVVEMLEVHHKNGDKMDNRLCNLAWISHKKHKDLHSGLLYGVK